MPSKHSLRKFLPIAAVLFVIVIGAITLVVHLVNRAGEPPEERVIVLDAGHGGHDPGAVYQGRYEKDDVLQMTLRVQELLLERGVPAVLTRGGDEFISLDGRVAIAHEHDADILVSIHRNAGGGRGQEIWIPNEPSGDEIAMAYEIYLRMLDASGMNSRGVRRGTPLQAGADFTINTADAITCLIEIGFMDYDGDNALFDENFEAIAAAIADGLMAW